MILAIIIAIFGIFLSSTSVLAGDSPILNSPANNSTVTSSALNWQAPSYQLYSSNPYRVQVDDDPSFSPSASIYRDTYKITTTYTPVLNTGTWYWRVKARDSSGIWSNWSETWTFILTNSTPTPIVTSTPTPTSAPTSSAQTTPNSLTSFTISNSPSQINSDQSFSVQVNLSLPSNPNTNFYLKGAFKKSDGSNYFGLTRVSNNWVKNGASYSSQYPINTDPAGNWSGSMKVQPDADDSGFTGGGDYIFKVARYTSSGSGPTWSNETTMNIISSSNEGQPLSDSQTTTSQASSTTKFQTTSISQANSIAKSTNPPKIIYQTASIAGVNYFATQSATPSAKIEVKNQKQVNPLLAIGFFLIFAGASCLGYIYLKKGRR